MRMRTTFNEHSIVTMLLSTRIIFSTYSFKSMDDNCGEWVECMGVASGCGEQEVGVASGSG